MIKECPVLKNNELVTVVRFGCTDVQLPSIHKEVKTIFVANENGRYFVVAPENVNKFKREKHKKKKNIIETTVKDAIGAEINCEGDIKEDNE